MNLTQLVRISRASSTCSMGRRYTTNTQTMQSVTIPLWKAMEDGSEKPIDEADLYKYQLYRWLSGEHHKLAMRYRKFNLRALLDISIKATGKDGNKCIKLLKCVEGQCNKAFVLTMDSGDEIVARLPNPNAGPAFYTLASDCNSPLRDIIGIPIPRIYSWSTDASNPVGAEYIIEEKATGQPLGTLWGKLSLATQLEIVSQVVEIEKKLASVSFSKHGCIYYESDLKSRSLLNYGRLDSLVDSTSASNIGQLSDFAIGPVTNPKFWGEERDTMRLDRGPWNSVADYATAVGKNELKWAASHATPRMNFHGSMESPETPEDYISLLRRYMTLVPCLIPTSIRNEQANTISHPDLHLDNIFIDPETNRIACIIDWQLASISPILLQRLHPRMLELSASAQPDQGKHEKSLLEHYYRGIVEAAPLRWKSLISDPLYNVRTDPIHLVPGCWDRKDLFSLRNALIRAMALWDEKGYGKTPYPVVFTEDELLQHRSEMDLIEGISGIMQQLQDEGFVPVGGMVRHEHYERSKALNDRFKQEFIDLAENVRQRELHAKVWPYQ